MRTTSQGWAIETTHAGRAWEVILEPVDDEQALVVITAYPVEQPEVARWQTDFWR